MEASNYVLSEESAKVITLMRQLQTISAEGADLIAEISSDVEASEFQGVLCKARSIVESCLIDNINDNEDRTTADGKSII